MAKQNAEIKEVEQAPEDGDAAVLKKARTWLVDQLGEKETTCPFCAWERQSHANFASLVEHVEKKHPWQFIAAHQQGSLDANLREDERHPDEIEDLFELAGIDTQEQLDRPNYLHIPKVLQEKGKRDGVTFRWCARSKISRWLDAGAHVVERPTDLPQHEIPNYMRGGSTEDKTMRSMDAVLMAFPAEVIEQRRAMKRRANEDQLAARAEDTMRIQDEYEKKIYDKIIRRSGVDSTTARQVAKAMSRGDLRHGDGKAHHGLEIARGAGEKRRIA